MHCDISGFTAMSERLARLGNEGAELMAGVLNGFFETMLGVAERWGGVQMKFGGDAMLLYFEGDDGAARAAACGLTMQQEMRAFRRVTVGGELHELRMRAGIHAGRFLSLSLGRETLHYMLAGPDASRATEVEAQGKAGAVAISIEGTRGLGPDARLRRHTDALRLVNTADAVASAFVAPPAMPGLSRYLPPPIRARVDAGAPVPAAEHRRVTVMFIHVGGSASVLAQDGEAALLRQMDAYVGRVIESVERHGGILAGSDVSEHGEKLIALFGAPVSTETDEENAVRAAHEISTALRDAGPPGLTFAVGINTGPVFAGEIGSSRRREYTVIGDAVNVAARLMAAAHDGEVLISDATASRCAHAFALRRLRPIRVKGKSQPLRLHRLEGAAAAPASRAHALPMLGRDRELALLEARLLQGAGRRVALVTGDAGIGKSRLLAALEERAVHSGFQSVRLQAHRHAASTPYAAWEPALRSLFGIGAGTPGRAFDALRRAVRALAPGHIEFAGLVADVIGIARPPDSLLDALDARSRKDRLFSIVTAAVRRACADVPRLFLLDDAHRCDAISLELLAAVVDARPEAAFCISSREDASPLRADVRVRLGPLSPEDARDVLRAAGMRSGLDVDAVVRRAQGNPLFLYELATAPAGVAMPDTVSDVVLARIDRLPPEAGTVLRLAAVIGATFDTRAVRVLAAQRGLTGLGPALEQLRAAGLVVPAGRGTFAFEHVLARDVAYETLLYADRRRLHRTMATHLERTQGSRRAAPELLYHFEAAGEYILAARAGIDAGDHAASLFANDDARRYYERALALLDRSGDQAEADRSYVLERIGDTLETVGRHREAIEQYGAALERWREAPRRRRALVLTPAEGARGREALLCRKVAVSYERSSDYEASLAWLERALSRAPQRATGARAAILASRSVALFRLGQFRAGVQVGAQAVRLARRAGDKQVLAYAHSMLASSYVERGELRRAVDHLRPAVAIYEELFDLRGQAAAGNNLGSCYQLLGIMDGALYHYAAALRADERLGNRVHAAIIHNNIGEVQMAIGRVDDAIAHLQEVISTHAEHPEIAGLAGLAHVNLSRCMLALGDTGKARVEAERGIRLLKSIRALGVQLEAELQRAEVLLSSRRYRQALEESARLLGEVRAIEARLLEARALRLLARAQRGCGDGPAALESLQSSRRLAMRSGAQLEEALTLVELAAHPATGSARAARYLERAVDIFSSSGAEQEQRAAERLLAAVSGSDG